MDNKKTLKELKKELVDLRENDIFERELASSKVGNEIKHASVTLFLLMGFGSFIILATCWDLLKPMLSTHTDTRPIIGAVGVVCLFIGIYQFITLKQNVKDVTKREISNQERKRSIRKQIIDLEG